MSASNRRRVLDLLTDRGDAGAVTAELMQPDVGGERFGSRIDELRKEGHVVVSRYERKGSYRYFLMPKGVPLTAAPAVGPAVPATDDLLAAVWQHTRDGWLLDLTDRRVLAEIEDALFPEPEKLAA